MKPDLIRYKRYAIFLLNYIFKERIRGLDFTMRDMHLLKETDGQLHGYSITPASTLEEIFRNLEIGAMDNFLDVGCGKGFVLWQASRQAKYRRITGIDIDERLIRIANANIRKLKLDNVEAICADAVNFDAYSEYNHLFFFNPFSAEVFKKVFDSIASKLDGRKITLIYYDPICDDYIRNTGKFVLNKKIYCRIRNYYTHIYESI